MIEVQVLVIVQVLVQQIFGPSRNFLLMKSHICGTVHVAPYVVLVQVSSASTNFQSSAVERVYRSSKKALVP